MDFMVVKSKHVEDYPGNIARMFNILDNVGTKLNLNKCTFAGQSRKSLGFIIFERVIEANLDKIQAILNMEPQSVLIIFIS